MIQRLIDLVNRLFSSITTEDSVDINLASDFTSLENKGFFLYVGVEGIVKATTWKGTVITRNFVVGYHPIKLKKVFSSANGTTATDLGACF